jgi:GntR family transcriptional regulator, trigonelline degradation regulator
MARRPDNLAQSGSALASPSLPVIQRSAAPLRRNVVDALRTAIVEGRLAPGSRLIERELIGMTGVSRTVIREALRQLESEGVVETVPNKGPIVRALTIDEAKDLYLIRSVLEGLSARMFVLNAGAADVARLKQALDGTIASYRGGDPEAIMSAKNLFYDILFAGAGSEMLSSMIGMVHVRVWRWRALGLGHPRRSPARSAESIRELKALYQAIRKRDADLAETIARREVTNAANEIFRILDAAP